MNMSNVLLDGLVQAFGDGVWNLVYGIEESPNLPRLEPPFIGWIAMRL